MWGPGFELATIQRSGAAPTVLATASLGSARPFQVSGILGDQAAATATVLAASKHTQSLYIKKELVCMAFPAVQCLATRIVCWLTGDEQLNPPGLFMGLRS